MPSVVVFSNTAPPPNQNDVNATFQVPVEGLYLLYAAGSGSTPTVNTTIRIQVILNDTVLSMASVFSNESSSHKAVVPFVMLVHLKAGQNSAEMTAAPGAIVDFADFFTMTLTAA